MKRRCIALATLLLAVGMPSAGTASTTQLAQRTVIRSEGNNGIRLWVPERVDYDMWLTTLEVTGGSAAFVAMGAPDGERCEAFQSYGEVCISHQGWEIPPSWNREFYMSGGDPSTFEVGWLDIYILTDGVAELTIVLKGLTGEVEVEAQGTIGGFMEQIPRRCGLDGCLGPGFGGVTHTLNGPAFAEVIAYDHSGTGPTEGLVGIGGSETCIYPWYSYPASADPSDHPNGCDWIWEADQPRDAFHLMSSHLRYLANPGGRVHTLGQFTRSADGPTYLGFRGHSQYPLNPNEGYGAFGVWLDMGISLASTAH